MSKNKKINVQGNEITVVAINEQDFKPLEFEGLKKQAGLNAFTLSPQKWINQTMLLVLLQNQADMVEFTHIKILLSSLPVGFRLNLNFIL